MAKAATIKTRDVRPKAAPPAPAATKPPAADAPENPRAVAGSNAPPNSADTIIASVQLRLGDDYGELTRNTIAALDLARGLPVKIEDEKDRAAAADAIRTLRDTYTRAESHREAEKSPYLRAGQAVDAFFDGFKGRLKKARDILQARLDDYQAKLAAEERARREAAAAEQRRQADAARLAAEEAATEQRRREEESRKAEEAAVASSRKKKQDDAEAAARADAAARARADELSAQAAQAERQAERMETHAEASTADMVRTRTAAGALATARTEKKHEIADYALLPLDKLRPFIKRDALDAAVKLYIKTNDLPAGSDELPGVRIYIKDSASVR